MTVNNMQEMRRQLFCEQLEQWVEKLSSEKPVESDVVEELTVRLLAMAVLLLRQHGVNERRRCRLCGWSTWKWQFWCRRPRCAVFRSVDLVVGQGLDVVWWQLLESAGREVRLDEVREWVEQRKQRAHALRNEQ